jgi:carbamoyl-phosphate synthase large subunit
MEKKNVLVTGIGGNVGQGIIKNIRAFSDQIKIIGTGISDFSSGNYLCDVTYKVPYAYEENYISAIIDIVKKEKVDLIIPSTDYEVYYLAANKSAIPCTLAASEALAAEIYLDKYKTFEYHKKYGIPFANAAEPAAYDG